MKTTQEKIDEKKKELQKLEEQLKKEQEVDKIKKLVKIKLSTGEIEVEKHLHIDMNSRNKIKIPQGYRLLNLFEFLEIWNNHRDKLDYGDKLPDEIVKQPIKENEEYYPYWNVWFSRLDNRSVLVGYYRGLNDVNRVRGVRFVKLKAGDKLAGESEK